MKTLCVDIGGTRIKYAIIDNAKDLNQLKGEKTNNTLTLGWLNHSLPDLFRSENKLGIVYQYQEGEFDRVAIGFPGSINPDGELRDRGDLVEEPRKVPREIRAKIEKLVKKPVVVINDADAWLRGIKVIHENNSSFLSIILGTGIGVGIMQSDANTPDLIDVNHLSWKGSNLEKEAGKSINPPCKVHGIVGKGFFPWVENEKKYWDAERIRKKYTCRVDALLKDIINASSLSASTLQKIYFAGGGAEWLDSENLGKESGRKVEILTRTHGLEFDPDLIPLIGLGLSVSKLSARLPS